MEVKIGIADITRELSVKTDSEPDELAKRLADAVESGGVFELTDEKGRRVLIPARRIAYLDLGATETRPVGFGVAQ